MASARERAVWTAIPSGTPSHPSRLSVVVSPRIEGTGRAKVRDLQRFADWPSALHLDRLSVRVDGREVEHAVATDPRLIPDSALWKQIFDSELDVDLVDLAKLRADAGMNRVPIAAPVAQSTAVFKQIYRQRVAQQAGADVPTKSLRDALGVNLNEPVIDSWQRYLGELSEAGVSSTTSVPDANLAAETVRLMRFHEIYHSRPPLAVFPVIVQDERELGERERVALDVKMLAKAQEVVLRGVYKLPRFDESKSVGRIRFQNPPTYGVRNRREPDDFVILAATGDHVAGGGIGFRLRPGETIDVEPDDSEWCCRAVVVQVQESDDGAILYARHVYPASGKGVPHSIEFRLPPDPADGFTVTIRSLEPQEVVVTAASLRVEILEGHGRILRRKESAWTEEVENREEFHRRVATLRSYPALLRRLGLIVDLQLPEGVLLADGVVRVVPTDSSARDDIVPWTRYVATDPSRYASLFLPANREDAKASIRDGLLSNNESRTRFKLIQLDGDAAAMKNLQQARSQAVYANALRAMPNVVDLAERGDTDRGGDLAALRQIGLALCDLEAVDDTRNALKRGKAVTDALCVADASCPELASKPERPQDASLFLFADDLLAGYRVDVRRRSAKTEGPWRSLCTRDGRYHFPGESLPNDAGWPWSDEGFLSTTADTVQDPKGSTSGLRQSQTIFRWDGWSLVAPRPGMPMEECGTGIAPERAETNDDTVRVRFSAGRRSLERLRLGERYSFRLRTVDLAGNGLNVDDATTVATKPDDPRIFNSGCYERVEPVTPPIVAPMHLPGEGEGNDQLVIRRRGDRTADRSWLLLPPGTTAPFAELHGEFDGFDACRVWTTLRDHDGGTPTWDPQTRGRADTWIQEGWLCAHGGFRLPYLADPLVDRVLVRQRGADGIVSTIGAVNIAHDRKHDRYPQRITGRRIRVESAKTPRLRGGDGLEVGIPPGRIARIEVASTPATEDFGLFGLVSWCQCGPKDEIPCDEVQPSGSAPIVTPEDLQRAACAGDLGLITPSRELTLVHAVERPLLPAGRKSLSWVSDRKYRFGNPVKVILGKCEVGSDTGCSFDLAGDVWIDKPSTGKLDIHLRWNDPIDNPQFPDVVEQPNGLDPFQVPVSLDRRDYVHFSGTAAECVDLTPMAPGKPCGLRETFPVAGKVRFEDGRHREVSLTFDATSRFVDYYEPVATRAEVTGHPDVEARYRRLSDPATVHFPARIEPAAPTPAYMVPTFRYTSDRRGKELLARRAGGCRIFVARDWFSSGSAEKLALIFAPTRTTSVARPLDELISVWGADPLWEPIEHDDAPHDRFATGLPIMPPRPVLDDVTNAEIAIPNLLTPLRIAAVDGKLAHELPEVELSIAAYTPQLDQQKNLWFIDVDITAPTYFSFLRLGLARYQPYAEEGKHLSVIVPAVISQLVPDCAVSVVPAKKKRCYEVTVVSTATPQNSPSITRTFEVMVLRHRATTSRVPSDLQDALPASTLTLVPNGDGEAKWRGTIDADDAGLCPQFIVVEKQTWAYGGCRIVGCVEVKR